MSKNGKCYVVLSDMHFGVSESTANDLKLLKRVSEFLQDLSKGGPIQIIFSGDLLDLNLSTYTHAVEGARGIVGLRRFLQLLHEPVAGQSLQVEKFVYLPGNHDYRIWDWLSTRQACMDVLAGGRSLRNVVHPLTRGKWQGRDSCIAGVFPGDWRDRVLVEYPDHEIATDSGLLLITHGHYFDPLQTLFKRLKTLIEKERTPSAAARRMFIETAAYQTLAGCASFTDWTREWVNLLVGPSNVASKLSGAVRGLLGLKRKDFLVSQLRGSAIDTGMLSALEFYLRYFRAPASPPAVVPRWVVFGHTHVQDWSSTAKINPCDRLFPNADIDAINAGAFLEHEGTLATFLVVDDRTSQPAFTPYCVDMQNRICARTVTDGGVERRTRAHASPKRKRLPTSKEARLVRVSKLGRDWEGRHRKTDPTRATRSH
jgi:UDP-2,3-diacylglucosamine pyrophosphatase LpxH